MLCLSIVCRSLILQHILSLTGNMRHTGQSVLPCHLEDGYRPTNIKDDNILFRTDMEYVAN